MMNETVRAVRRFPDWLKAEMPHGTDYSRVKNLAINQKLNTVCVSANCPNKGECWSRGTATFMIQGNKCTRHCRFCQIKSMVPDPLDWDEPERLAHTIKALSLKHAVITSVARDDLKDGGASHWAATIKTVKVINPGITMEVLIPDFRRGVEAVDLVIEAGPDIISHNLETVRRLTHKVRSLARYDRSLDLLAYVAGSGITTKTGIMVGHGETEPEVYETMDDALSSGVRVFTIGQYLKPGPGYLDVVEYVNPSVFLKYRNYGLEKGFTYIESAPLVRSSYHSERHVTGKKV
jgi:lipoic acid synthetase